MKPPFLVKAKFKIVEELPPDYKCCQEKITDYQKMCLPLEPFLVDVANPVARYFGETFCPFCFKTRVCLNVVGENFKFIQLEMVDLKEGEIENN